MGFIPITLPGTTGIKLALDFDTSTLYYNVSGTYEPVSITSGQVLDFINANKEVIYVDEIPVSGGLTNAIYVDGWGQTRFWNALDKEWIYISNAVSNEISEDTLDDNNIPTTKAVYEFVQNSKEVIYNVNLPISGTNDALYVDDAGQLKYWNESDWIDVSTPIVTEITEDTMNNEVIPTTEAVYNFVNSVSYPSLKFVDELLPTDKPDSFVILNSDQLYAVSETEGHIPLSIGVEDTISIDATNDTVPGTKAVYDYVQTNKGVKYQEEIPVTGNSDSLYIGEDGQIKYWNESDWIDVSTPIVTEITEDNIGEEVPTAEAVYNFVKSEEKDPVSFVSDLPVSGVANSFVILDSDQLYATNENNENIPLSIGVVDVIDENSTNDNVPGTKAVYDLFESMNTIGTEIVTLYPTEYNYTLTMNQNNKIYKVVLNSNGFTINVNTDGLLSNYATTVELWLEMPGDIYDFSIPNVTWIEEPLFDDDQTCYVITLRWTGKKVLANLAYTYSIAGEI